VTTNPTDTAQSVGSNVTFTVAARGSPSPTVQWQVQANTSNSFSDIPGATSPTLSVMSVTASQSGNQYRAVFANACSTVNTTAATLTVYTPPLITTQPTDQAVCTGQTVSFTAASGGSPAPSVQWQVSTGGG